MNPTEPTPSTTPRPSNDEQPAPAATYVGQSNIIDRSQPPAAYPSAGTPASADHSELFQDQYKAAASSLDEAKVIICGVASSTAYILIIYYVKNLWAAAGVSALLAFAAIYFALVNYRRTGKTTPLTIVGLSAATITLVYIANALVSYAVLRSLAGGYYN